MPPPISKPSGETLAAFLFHQSAQQAGLEAARAKWQKQYDKDLAAGLIQPGDKLTYKEQQQLLRAKEANEKRQARFNNRDARPRDDFMTGESLQMRDRSWRD